MRRWSWLVAAAIVVIACDTGAPARIASPPRREIESGGRLRARKWVVGTHEVFRDFFDRTIGEPCTFTNNVGPGPSYRCLPVGAALHSEGQGPYLDAACKEAVGSVLTAPSAYVIVERRNACGAERSISRAGGVEMKRTYAFDGEACVPLSTTPARVQRLEREIPTDAFVRAMPAALDLSARIVMQSLVAEDGARQPFEAFDVERREPVVVDLGNEGGQRWRPSRVAFVGGGAALFSDDTCSVQVAAKVGRDATCPLTAALVFQGTCGRHVVHALGGPIDSPRSMTDAGCVAAKTRSLTFAVGAPISAETFAPASRVEIEGGHAGGPIRRRGFIGPNGKVAVWGDLIAPNTGEPCTVTRAIDGVARCLPAQGASAGAFSDDECTAPAIRVASTGCETEPFPSYVHIDEAPDFAQARAFAVVEQVRAVFALDKGRCRASTLAPMEQAYAVSELDVGLFPVAKEE